MTALAQIVRKKIMISDRKNIPISEITYMAPTPQFSEKKV